MWVRTGMLLFLVGCESGITITLDLSVGDEVAETYSPEVRGLLRANPQGGTDTGWNVAPVCGLPFEVQAVEDHLGCMPDEEETTVSAWIVPVPDSWDSAFCDLELLADSFDLGLDPILYPLDALPVPDVTNPQVEVDAVWKHQPICGGTLDAEVAL